MKKEELPKELKNNPESENIPQNTKKPDDKVNMESTSEKIAKVQEFVKISKEDWDNVQKQLKMLYSIADKGRLHNYESQNVQKKPFRVKLSVIGDKIMIGWQTKRDELIKDPRTGATVGERQEIEAKVIDKEGKISTIAFNGYVAFSNARYDKRIEAEVVNRKEDYKGDVSFDVKLPDGRVITLDARFVN